jgi:hypothetical protein
MVIARALGKDAVGEASLDGRAGVLAVAEPRGRRDDVCVGGFENVWSCKEVSEGEKEHKGAGDEQEGTNDIP